MKLKPWYKVIEPREDLKEGRPMDASEFAVHLDKVRAGTAPKDYCDPEQFMARTYLTKSLIELSAEVLRRLSGETTQTNAVINMATQFGGGKTHALTLLYHLAKSGKAANTWRDVPKILEKARLQSVPAKCAMAIFVGTEFDSIKGRGGDDGTPLRKTPWGELAFQLGGKEAFAHVAKHDEQFVDPKGDVINAFIPKDRPCLILMDEIINYVSTYREAGYGNKLYNFLQCLSETVRGMKNVVLVVSIPASELSYTDKDVADQQRFKNMLDRLGKAIMMAAESETAEIIRRRLFDWDEQAVNSDGKVILPADAIATCRAFSEWIIDNKQLLPGTFPFDHAKEYFEASYPFHPALISVFERKWQGLPRFQQTRGVLRLLALWVSQAYIHGMRGQNKDALIGQGTAPFDDPIFRVAVFEQLGNNQLEGAVTADIEGKIDSHAMRLDKEAEDSIRKAQVHKKTATVVFFESNGGQSKNLATIPEIRLGVAEPDIDIGFIDSSLEALVESCYYLNVERNQYRFGLKENLNKRFADRKASIKPEEVLDLIREEVQKVFPAMEGIERIFFPGKSSQIPDRPVVTFAIVDPEHGVQEDTKLAGNIEKMTAEYGTSARTFKSALIWVAPDSISAMHEDARKLLAWNDIEGEGLKLDEAQERQLRENIKKAQRDLRESVWRSYKHVFLLSKDNSIGNIDLGLVTSSSAESLTKYVVNYLLSKDEMTKDPIPRQLVKNWPGFTEWSTKGIRDAFYASPLFPRLLNPEAIRRTIARGVEDGQIAYVTKESTGGYTILAYKKSINPEDVDIADDVFIIKGDVAEKHIKPPVLSKIAISPERIGLEPGKPCCFSARGIDQFGREMAIDEASWSCKGGTINETGGFSAAQQEGTFTITAKAGKITGAATVMISKTPSQTVPGVPGDGQSKLTWSGEVAPQKWMNLYTKVLTRFVKDGDLKIRVSIEATPKDGVTDQIAEETKSALRELGLGDDVNVG